MSGTFGHNEVMAGEFDRLHLIEEEGAARPGPWTAACLSGQIGPVWVFVDTDGNVVPLSSVRIAWRATRKE